MMKFSVLSSRETSPPFIGRRIRVDGKCSLCEPGSGVAVAAELPCSYGKLAVFQTASQNMSAEDVMDEDTFHRVWADSYNQQ